MDKELKDTIQSAVDGFVSVATSKQQHQVDAMIVIGLLKLVRRGAQSHRIAVNKRHLVGIGDIFIGRGQGFGNSSIILVISSQFTLASLPRGSTNLAITQDVD